MLNMMKFKYLVAKVAKVVLVVLVAKVVLVEEAELVDMVEEVEMVEEVDMVDMVEMVEMEKDMVIQQMLDKWVEMVERVVRFKRLENFRQGEKGNLVEVGLLHNKIIGDREESQVEMPNFAQLDGKVVPKMVNLEHLVREVNRAVRENLEDLVGMANLVRMAKQERQGRKALMVVLVEIMVQLVRQHLMEKVVLVERRLQVMVDIILHNLKIEFLVTQKILNQKVEHQEHRQHLLITSQL